MGKKVPSNTKYMIFFCYLAIKEITRKDEIKQVGHSGGGLKIVTIILDFYVFGAISSTSELLEIVSGG